MAAIEEERRASNREILEKVTELAHKLELYIVNQNSTNAQVDVNVTKLCDDMYGNGKKGIKTMVDQLWENAQVWKLNGNAVMVAVLVSIATSLISIFTSMFMQR